MDDVCDEPVFRGVAGPRSESDPDGVWGEPALADEPSAEGERARHRDVANRRGNRRPRSIQLRCGSPRSNDPLKKHG